MTDEPPRLPVSKIFIFAALFAFGALVLLVISFSSPYWIESYSHTYSEFVRMGLWEVCFNNYRHPKYQYDEKFDGCHWLYSYKLNNLRDWIQPGWLMFVQAMCSLSIIFSAGSLSAISILMMRFFLKYEMFVMVIALSLSIFAGLPIFFAVCVYGTQAFDRSWLQYPNFNHLSWSYGLAVVSCLFHLASSGFLLKETFSARERHRRFNSYLYNVGQAYKPEIFRFENSPYMQTTEAI